jgi:hypothetical protein
MKVIRLFAFVTIVLSSQFDGLARAAPSWYVDHDNATGSIARVDLPDRVASRSFMVIFEYKRRCDPLFSYVSFRGGTLGRLLRIQPVPLGVFSVDVDGVAHTWHGAVAEYQLATEKSVGITKLMWESLLASPRYVSFLERDSVALMVPVLGLGSAVKGAADSCLRKL